MAGEWDSDDRGTVVGASRVGGGVVNAAGRVLGIGDKMQP